MHCRPTRHTPALIIAGTHSGSGKTTVTLALLAALARRGLRVQAFKVGPDFIDPGHHAHLTGRSGRNLDTWLLDREALAATYERATVGADIAVIEGVMGLFDGRGPLDESGSTGDLARRWDLPVVLVVDARGIARSVAPLVLGFASFDRTVRVCGVIANRVGGPRHFDEYLVPALRSAADAVEPLGYLVRDDALAIPSRHLGLLTAEELGAGSDFVHRLADAAEATLDLERLIALAHPPRLHSDPVSGSQGGSIAAATSRVRVAVARDAAFCFYYQDNLDLLAAEGADIVPFSPLEDHVLPEGTALLYLGGGYPEVFAAQLAANGPMRSAVRAFHGQGGSIFAECGGMMACAESLRDVSGAEWPLWGLIPARVTMHQRFAALGYVTIAAEEHTPFGQAGTLVRGHEFHYSTLEPRVPVRFTTRLLRPDRESTPDGIRVGNLFAGYAHSHFGSNPHVARSLLESV
jgi:cobyrinic acid a,c-diamide synthase